MNFHTFLTFPLKICINGNTHLYLSSLSLFHFTRDFFTVEIHTHAYYVICWISLSAGSYTPALVYFLFFLVKKSCLSWPVTFIKLLWDGICFRVKMKISLRLLSFSLLSLSTSHLEKICDLEIILLPFLCQLFRKNEEIIMMTIIIIIVMEGIQIWYDDASYL